MELFFIDHPVIKSAVISACLQYELTNYKIWFYCVQEVVRQLRCVSDTFWVTLYVHTYKCIIKSIGMNLLVSHRYCEYDVQRPPFFCCLLSLLVEKKHLFRRLFPTQVLKVACRLFNWISFYKIEYEIKECVCRKVVCINLLQWTGEPQIIHCKFFIEQFE